MNKKLNHKKLFNIIFATLIIFLLVNIIYNIKKNNTPKVTCYARYEVGINDNLWNIAEKYQIEGWDIRNTIIEIQDKNKLKNDIIKPGQILEVPIYENK